MSFVTQTLKEALADLYVIDKQYEKAFAIYADLRKPGIFEFIEEHNLHDALQDKALPLMTLDPKRAVALLVQQREFIKPSEVVSQLRKAENNSTYRYLLHEYLHALFENDPHAGKDFHGLQVIYFVGKLNILIIILIYGILFLANIYKEHFTNLTI
jgi:hypothetical protein